MICAGFVCNGFTTLFYGFIDLLCYEDRVYARGIVVDVHKNVILSSSRFQDQTFEIDYDLNAFMLDGKFFQFMSGTMQYFGSFSESWSHKLKMMKSAGLNTVDV